MSRNRFVSMNFAKFSSVVLLVVLASCAVVAQPAAEGRVITETEANQTISARAGEILTIKLATQPGTGYSWQFSSNKPKVATLEGQPEIVSDGDTMAGGAKTQVFHVRILSSGKAKLMLKYDRPWEKTVAPQKTFMVTVRARGKK